LSENVKNRKADARAKGVATRRIMIGFHVANTENDREWVTVFGEGRNWHTNPFHPIEERRKSEDFGRARLFAIEVFDAAHNVTRPSRLMSVPQWLRRYPGRLRELFRR
jgi:hypothetical protein